MCSAVLPPPLMVFSSLRNPQGGGTVLKQACQPFPLPWLQVSEREMKPFHFVVVNSLRLYKLRRGDVLAVFLENRPEYVGVLLGLSKVQNTVQYTKIS